MKLGIGAYIWLLVVVTLLGYGVMYIIRCVRRREVGAAVGMTALGLASLALLVLIWIQL